VSRRRPLRCCGRFCYWRLPVGPWACVRPTCTRTYDGPMPRAAVGRFWTWIDQLAARIPPWTDQQRAFAERTFRAVLIEGPRDAR
jgi:hypothetical protein